MVNITNPGLATYVINGLAAGTYYIVLSAVNTNGGESELFERGAAELGTRPDDLTPRLASTIVRDAASPVSALRIVISSF